MTIASTAAVQKRTISILIGSQIAGGLGVAGAIAVGALVVTEVFGREELSGLVQSSQVLGAALLAIPAARLAVSMGRRGGLALAYGLGGVGAALAVIASQIQVLPLLLIGTALLGGGTTAGLQARYAATDLADEHRRGRALSVVVWSTTIGAVAGPNLAGPTGHMARAFGLEPLSGPFLVAAVALVVAAGIVLFGLRPDPLLTARQLAALEDGDGSGDRQTRRARGGAIRAGWMAIKRSPQALLALAAVVVAHTVMVTVMVMTPVHMAHGGASVTVIGVVISGHVAGMFAFSPIMGWLTDTIGRLPVLAAGIVVQLASVVLTGTSHEGHSAGLAAGMFLLGLGWSASTVGGSTLLTDSVTLADRPVAQGASDLFMGLAAAGGGALAGIVVNGPGFGVLNVGAAVLLVIPTAMLAIPACRRPIEHPVIVSQ